MSLFLCRQTLYQSCITFTCITFTVYSYNVRGLRPDVLPVLFYVCDIFCIQETSSALQDIKLIDIECDCCNTIEFYIGISTVVIIYGGDTLIVACYFFFFSDHFFVVDNLCMHHLNSNSIL